MRAEFAEILGAGCILGGRNRAETGQGLKRDFLGVARNGTSTERT